MSHVKTKTIKLTEEEIENFRAIADKFNVKFDVKPVKNNYHVTAPEDKLIQWGYYEQNYERIHRRRNRCSLRIVA